MYRFTYLLVKENFFKENVVYSDRRSLKVTVTDKIPVGNPAVRYNGELTNQNLNSV